MTSSADMLNLVGSVNQKMARVVGELMNKRGRTGATPEITECMKTARTLFHRYRLRQVLNRDGDPVWMHGRKAELKHNEREAGQVIRLAQWLVEQHCSLRGMDYKPFSINPETLVVKNAG